MLSSTCHYTVVNVVQSVIFAPRDSGFKRFLYAFFMHLYPYIYAFVYCVTLIVLESCLLTAWLTQARGCWVDHVLAGASISRGSPGLPLPLPYIYIYIYILYIRSPGLPITKGSPDQTVQSDRAGPGPYVYKRKSVVLGISFSRPISIH
jgi:hypothetical protein